MSYISSHTPPQPVRLNGYWNNCSPYIYTSKNKLAAVVMDLATNYLESFRQAGKSNDLIGKTGHSVIPTPRWQPPPPGQFRMNVDAALNPLNNVMGVGAII